VIDWFASKIGMLIFVTVVFSVLLGFLAMESSAFQHEQKARMAEDVARLIDAAGNGGSVTYEPVISNYVLKVDGAAYSVSVDDVSRQFLAEAADATISDLPKFTIHNDGDIVYVSS